MKRKHFQKNEIKYLVEVEEMFLEIVSTTGKLLLASRTFLHERKMNIVRDNLKKWLCYLFLQFVLTFLTNVVTVDTTKNLGVRSVGFNANLKSLEN